MPSASHIAHAGLVFAHPMSEPAVDAAIAALPLPTDPLVLDTGCGSGEILLRTLKAHSPARGLGVDLDADAIAEARQRATGVSVRFEVRDAAREVGFDAVRESFASENDWAHYEETLAANAERHGTPDTLAYARRIRHRRALPGGTDTLGFALLVLSA